MLLLHFASLRRQDRKAVALVSFAAAVVCSFLVERVAAGPDNKNQQGFYLWPMWVRVTLCIVSVLLSAMFCGLTIGLLGIDTVTLEIIASAGAEPERTFATKILPIRHLGHQLLASLLVGNMLTLVLTSQLVAAIVQSSELVNFILGTLVVLLFGEIIPMAYCNKGSNGLRAGVASLPVLKTALFILYPVAKPLGMLLDCIVSHDAGQLYDKNEIRKLIRVHYEKYADQSGINQDELRMMLSALEMNEVTVASAMTALDRTLMLEASLPLDGALQRKLWEYGKSRVPVYAGTKSNIIGILYVKDLINVATLRNDLPITIRDFIVDHPRELLVVKEKARLNDALKIFESHYTQMLFVERVGDYHGSFASGSVVGSRENPKGEPPGAAHARSGAYSEASSPQSAGAPGTGSSSRHYRNKTASDGPRRDSGEGKSLAASHPADASAPRTHGTEREWMAAPDSISPRTLLDPESTKSRVFVGVVTLEDIIERLIASEILDEDEYNVDSDGGDDDTNSDEENELLLRSIQRSFSLQKQPIKVPRVNFYSYGLSSGTMQDDNDDLSEEQKWALASYMTRSFVFFASWSVPKVKFLLDEVGDRHIFVADDSTRAYERHRQELNGAVAGTNTAEGVPITVEAGVAAAALAKSFPVSPAAIDPARVLYTAGQPSRTFTLLLSGGMNVTIGKDEFRTELRSFSSLGEEIFNRATPFVPDYTAVVSRTSRFYSISHDDVYRVERKINAIRRQRGRRPLKMSTFDAAAAPVSAADKFDEEGCLESKSSKTRSCAAPSQDVGIDVEGLTEHSSAKGMRGFARDLASAPKMRREDRRAGDGG